ncbi:MAG: AAA family ATPase [Proteobacteria bacterium]|nr:AAA family ATPase [Pseudomonadota bacterium]MBU1710525.1 AAA family ATPase [Pseudomonadota bacterium]
MKIAISGKGGVGKTTILSLLAAHLSKGNKEVLVIDADPSPHMAQTIGVTDIDSIRPIADMKDLLVERSGKVEGSPFYNINPQVDDIMSRYMIEHNGIKLMVLGAIQTAEGGCACPENTVLKRMLTKLILSPSQTILLDMEAGVEHLGRGTIASVDHLLIVVIPSKSSVRTALKIQKLAREAAIPRIHFVGNLIESIADETFLENALGAKLLASFPDSQTIRKAERNEQPITELHDEYDRILNELMKGLQS